LKKKLIDKNKIENESHDDEDNEKNKNEEK
jgi:hypothetical protein